MFQSCLNVLQDFFVLRKSGSKFHNLKAESENEQSYCVVLDLETDKRPFEDDLNEQLWAVDIGFSTLVMYVGVYYSVLCYVVNLSLGIESHLSSWNMVADDVPNIACKIM